MRLRGCLTVLCLTLCVALQAAEPRPGIGLVLSGGGAKGIAHIGVIQALEENEIPIDYITGTSMGAIVGSLYAAGYTPAEMMQVLASKSFADWSTGTITPDETYYFVRQSETPSWIRFNIGKDSTHVTSTMPMSLINPLPMNIAFPEIYARYTAQCGADFDRLFVPFRCVTSDIYRKRSVVLGSGSLGDAVRMSMSFPGVFEPIDLDGVPMYDGGLYDNYPVDVMLDVFNPAHIIGVNVGSKNAAPDSRNPMGQLENMIESPQDFPFPDDRGINIRIDLDRFGLLDWGSAAEIYGIGYRRGLAMADSIRSRFGAGMPLSRVNERRREFRARTPEVRISDITVSGGSPSDNRYLSSLFRRPKGRDWFTLPEVRRDYYLAVSSGRLQNFVPYPVLNPDTTFTFNFKALVKKDFTGGIGGYVSTASNSMLFFHAGYTPMVFKGFNGALNLWIGQNYAAAEGLARFNFNSRPLSALELQLVCSRIKYHETEQLFFRFNTPDFIHHTELYGKLFYSLGPTMHTIARMGVGGARITDRYYAELSTSDPARHKDRGTFDLAQAEAVWTYNTLDNPRTATSGSYARIKLAGIAGKYRLHTHMPGEEDSDRDLAWIQADIRGTHYFDTGKHFSLGIQGEALLSTRKLLPTYQASIVAAEAITPTPDTRSVFNPALRANSFLTAAVSPIWKMSSRLQLRSTFHTFVPLRKIEPVAGSRAARYGKWLGDPQFFGETRLQFALPLGTISAYANYATGGVGWNFGISLGTFILAPEFL